MCDLLKTLKPRFLDWFARIYESSHLNHCVSDLLGFLELLTEIS
jgi:hypothetical protein